VLRDAGEFHGDYALRQAAAKNARGTRRFFSRRAQSRAKKISARTDDDKLNAIAEFTRV
jgi:hypothetical protein